MSISTTLPPAIVVKASTAKAHTTSCSAIDRPTHNARQSALKQHRSRTGALATVPAQPHLEATTFDQTATRRPGGTPLTRYWLIPPHLRPNVYMPRPTMSPAEIGECTQRTLDRFYR